MVRDAFGGRTVEFLRYPLYIALRLILTSCLWKAEAAIQVPKSPSQLTNSHPATQQA